LSLSLTMFITLLSRYIFISFLTFHDRQQKYIKRKIMMNGKNRKLFVDNQEVIDKLFFFFDKNKTTFIYSN
jgi:hypothetical protein